jgi:hypothetical protein
MQAKSYQTYEEAARDYRAQFATLLDVPEGVEATTTRGAGDVPAELLIDRADEIAEVSANMVALSRSYFEAENFASREGISAQFIVQASAELQLATELLQLAVDEQSEQTVAATTRAARGTALRDIITTLEKSMQIPVMAGLAATITQTRSAATQPTTTDEAKKALQTAVDQSTATISQRVRELGGDITFDLVSSTAWEVVLVGASLVRKDIADRLNDLKEKAGILVSQAVSVATKTLLNVYDKILALLGKDGQDQARKQIKDWLESIEKQKAADLFEVLIDKLYRVRAFRTELAGWLTRTTAQIDTINQTTESVSEVAGKFTVLVGRMGTLESALVFARLLKLPHILLIVAGLQIALLSVLVYAGYDYIGYQEVQFVNIIKGVAQVVRERLAIEEVSSKMEK